ncbi:MAG: hypothetical protein AAFN77_02285 [Planctomycetota bacterium]
MRLSQPLLLSSSNGNRTLGSMCDPQESVTNDAQASQEPATDDQGIVDQNSESEVGDSPQDSGSIERLTDPSNQNQSDGEIKGENTTATVSTPSAQTNPYQQLVADYWPYGLLAFAVFCGIYMFLRSLSQPNGEKRKRISRPPESTETGATGRFKKTERFKKDDSPEETSGRTELTNPTPEMLALADQTIHNSGVKTSLPVDEPEISSREQATSMLVSSSTQPDQIVMSNDLPNSESDEFDFELDDNELSFDESDEQVAPSSQSDSGLPGAEDHFETVAVNPEDELDFAFDDDSKSFTLDDSTGPEVVSTDSSSRSDSGDVNLELDFNLDDDKVAKPDLAIDDFDTNGRAAETENVPASPDSDTGDVESPVMESASTVDVETAPTLDIDDEDDFFGELGLDDEPASFADEQHEPEVVGDDRDAKTTGVLLSFSETGETLDDDGVATESQSHHESMEPSPDAMPAFDGVEEQAIAIGDKANELAELNTATAASAAVGVGAAAATKEKGQSFLSRIFGWFRRKPKTDPSDPEVAQVDESIETSEVLVNESPSFSSDSTSPVADAIDANVEGIEAMAPSESMGGSAAIAESNEGTVDFADDLVMAAEESSIPQSPTLDASVDDALSDEFDEFDFLNEGEDPGGEAADVEARLDVETVQVDLADDINIDMADDVVETNSMKSHQAEASQTDQGSDAPVAAEVNDEFSFEAELDDEVDEDIDLSFDDEDLDFDSDDASVGLIGDDEPEPTPLVAETAGTPLETVVDESEAVVDEADLEVVAQPELAETEGVESGLVAAAGVAAVSILGSSAEAGDVSTTLSDVNLETSAVAANDGSPLAEVATIEVVENTSDEIASEIAAPDDPATLTHDAIVANEEFQMAAIDTEDEILFGPESMPSSSQEFAALHEKLDSLTAENDQLINDLDEANQRVAQLELQTDQRNDESEQLHSIQREVEELQTKSAAEKQLLTEHLEELQSELDANRAELETAKQNDDSTTSSLLAAAAGVTGGATIGLVAGDTEGDSKLDDEKFAELKINFEKKLKSERKKRKEAQSFLAEAEEQRNSVAATLRDAKQELLHLKDSIIEQEEESTSMVEATTQIESLQSELERVRQERNELQATLDSAQSDKAKHREELESIRQTLEEQTSELETTRGELKTVQGDLDSKTEDVGSYQSEVDAAKSELESIKAKMTEVETELVTAKEESATANSKLAEANSVLATARAEVIQKANEIEQMQLTLANTATKAQQLEANLDVVSDEFESKALDDSTSIEEFQSLKLELAEAHDQLAAVNSNRELIEAELSKKQEDLTSAQKELASAQERVEAASAEFAQQVKSLNERTEEITSQLSRLQENNREQQQEIKTLTQDLIGAREAFATARAEADTLRSQLDTVQASQGTSAEAQSRLASELATMLSRVQTAESQSAAELEKSSLLQSQYDKVQTALSAAQAKLATAQASSKDPRKEIEISRELMTKVTQIESDLKSERELRERETRRADENKRLLDMLEVKATQASEAAQTNSSIAEIEKTVALKFDQLASMIGKQADAQSSLFDSIDSPSRASSKAKAPVESGDTKLTRPKKSSGDNLKKISGIGKVIEEKLNDLGVHSFEQIANWSASDVKAIEEKISFPGRATRDNWVQQAKKYLQ